MNFKNENSILGLGWTHNFPFTKNEAWTEGGVSNLIFKLGKDINESFIIKIKLNSIIKRKNDSINFNIDVNNFFTKEFDLENINELKEESIFITINRSDIKDDIVYIKFKVNNPVTKFELLKSPDSRKLGVLVESLEIINN